jgi:hypothetical protein
MLQRLLTTKNLQVPPPILEHTLAHITAAHFDSTLQQSFNVTSAKVTGILMH